MVAYDGSEMDSQQDNEYDQGAADMAALMMQLAPMAQILIGPALGNRAMVDGVRNGAAAAMQDAGLQSVTLWTPNPVELTNSETVEIFLTALAASFELSIDGYMTLTEAKRLADK